MSQALIGSLLDVDGGARVVVVGHDHPRAVRVHRELSGSGVATRVFHEDAAAAVAWAGDHGAGVLALGDRIAQDLLAPLVRVAHDEYGMRVLLWFAPDRAEALTEAVLAGAHPVLDEEGLVREVLAWVADRGEGIAPVTRVGDLTLDVRAYDARVEGVWVGLGPVEFEVLHALASDPDHVVSRATLAARHWPGSPSAPSALSAVVARIRHKLRRIGMHGAVVTVRGVGYRVDSARMGAGATPGHRLRPSPLPV
ncbi:helix-turn-helix domain-containing protein [Serinibacter salmoneus]|uniref:helix-turn-helix domain-containing protein n=1 Tax=Serinibacter salmoneus TaxID=556530 RepID=UPI000BF8D171|nr:helix-turn-helix domain-containing protein [Serinibacter salmoneus]